MSWADSLGNARVLDKWRADAGIEFDIEKSSRRTSTLNGTAARQARQVASRSASIPGLAQEGLGGRPRL